MARLNHDIADAPTNILGKLNLLWDHTYVLCNKTNIMSLAAKLETKVISTMYDLDERPICGKFKVWVYIAHSLLIVEAVRGSKVSLSRFKRKLQS